MERVVCNVRPAQLSENPSRFFDKTLLLKWRPWSSGTGLQHDRVQALLWAPTAVPLYFAHEHFMALKAPQESTGISVMGHTSEGWSAAKHSGFRTAFELALKTYMQN